VKTFIVHVSVDADTKERAEAMVGDCIKTSADNHFNIEGGETAVVLSNTDEVEGSEFIPAEQFRTDYR